MQSATERSLLDKKANIHEFKKGETLPFDWDPPSREARITDDIFRVRGSSGHEWVNREAVEKRIQIQEKGGKTLEASKDECRKEVKIMLAARHAHAMPIITAYFHKPDSKSLDLYIIMEQANGGDLSNYLYNKSNTDDLQERWIGCLIHVVAYIHRLGIRHRDIKPQNVLVKSNEVLLADFGISKMSLGKTVPTTMPGWNKSRTTTHCAPEVNQAEGRSRGRSADIFSLGAVILEMLLAHKYNDDYQDLVTVTKHKPSKSGDGDSESGDEEQSFAENLDEVREFLDDFRLGGKRQVHAPSHTSILGLCRDMLRKNRDERPTADEIESRWDTLAKSADGVRGTASAAQLTCDQCSAGLAASKTKTDELLEACKSGKPDAADQVRALLTANPPEDRPDPNTEGAMHLAAVAGLRETLKALLDNGADVNTLDYAGQTALHYAAVNGHKNIVAFLLEHPDITASITAADLDGETPLHCAAAHGSVDVINLLLDKLDKLVATPGATVIVKGKMPINALDNDELTPLHHAARRGKLCAVKLLLKRGADKTAKALQNGATPAKFARDRGFSNVEREINNWDTNKRGTGRLNHWVKELSCAIV